MEGVLINCWCFGFVQTLEERIAEMTAGYRLGPFYFRTERLKTALTTETRAWKQAYGSSLNQSCGREMDSILSFFQEMEKPLSRPVKDLDDIRAHMAALNEIRESETRIDLTIAPIEEAYAMLGRYGLTFNDGNAERVDSLGYGWRLLRQQVTLWFIDIDII
jgi:dynein heavy chain